jgi:UDP-N-acetylmuramoylalanine--D-glutamate ligase
MCGDLNTATHTAFADASADTGSASVDSATILLSPAAASFDQFADFAARGNAFAELARRLAAPAAPPKVSPKVRGGAHA